jgi:hypothetical protein
MVSGRDTKQAPPEHKSGVVPLHELASYSENQTLSVDVRNLYEKSLQFFHTKPVDIENEFFLMEELHFGRNVDRDVEVAYYYIICRLRLP